MDLTKVTISQRQGLPPSGAPTTPLAAMNRSPRFKLFLMMVLEIAVWGAWLPLIFGYLPSLGFSATMPPEVLKGFVSHLHPWIAALFSKQAMILNSFPVAAIIGMFFSNQFADRNF